MVIVLVPVITLSSILIWYFMYAAGSTAIDAYTYTRLAWSYPAEKDLLSSAYKTEAAIMASKFLKDIEKERWESKGIKFVPFMRDDIPDGLFSGMFYCATHKQDMSPYYGNKVANTTFHGKAFISNNVSYQGNGVYRVRSVTTTNLEAYGSDGAFNQEAHKIPAIQNVYTSTIKLTPEKGAFGRVKLNWKQEDYEFVESSMSENKIDRFINALKIPGSLQEEQDKEVQERIKREPKI